MKNKLYSNKRIMETIAGDRSITSINDVIRIALFSLEKQIRIIIKTLTGAFPMSWQDGIGGDLVDYSITGASGGVGDYGGKRNQLVQNGNFESASGWSIFAPSKGTLSIDNGVATVTSLIDSGGAYDIGIRKTVANSIVGHKYLICADFLTETAKKMGFDFYGGVQYEDTIPNVWTNVSVIWDCNSAQNDFFPRPAYRDFAEGEKYKVRNCMSIDLTALFPNETITDVSTAKARIAEVMGEAEYYPYDAGSDYYKVPMVVTSGACVDLGTLNWYHREFSGVEYFVIDGLVSSADYNGYCKKYKQNQTHGVAEMINESMIIYSPTQQLFIRDDSFNDETAFKNSLNGVYLYYQRATDESWYIQNKTIYRTTQLTAGQTIRKTTDGLPNFTNLPTGYLQMGVDTAVAPSEGSVSYLTTNIMLRTDQGVTVE